MGGGLILVLAGAIFTLQGLGAVGGGNAMSGVTFWAIAGPVIALAGVTLAILGVSGGRFGQADRRNGLTGAGRDDPATEAAAGTPRPARLRAGSRASAPR